MTWTQLLSTLAAAAGLASAPAITFTVLRRFLMSSLFSNLISWAKQSPAAQQVKQQAIAEVSQAFEQAMAKASTHAPGIVVQLEPQMAAAFSTFLSGVLTQQK